MDNRPKPPLTYKIALYYNYIIALIFVVYGGVKLVLSFLDNNSGEIPTLILFTIYGIIFVTLAQAFKDQKKWGATGLLVVNAFFIVDIIYTSFKLDTQMVVLNIILAVFSAAIIYCLIAQPTKQFLNRPS